MNGNECFTLVLKINTNKMKKLIYILLFSLSQFAISQSNKSENVFWDLIDYKLYPEKFSDIGYVKNIDSRMFFYQLKIFEKDSTLIYYNYNIKKTDSIKFTIEEKKNLIIELKKTDIYTWNLSDEKNLIQVEYSKILEFLKSDKNRELKIISKPIFFRNNNIVCLFSVHLCCGHIYGYVNLSIFKKKNGKWEQWIPLVEGAF